jgi:phosphatidylserine/phosphatidylglycerophosphate/cardiolipin synthase-like enzyme
MHDGRKWQGVGQRESQRLSTAIPEKVRVMSSLRQFFRAVSLISVLLAGAAQHASGQERLCDTAFEDCREPLWALIDRETVGIDVSFWFMQDTSYATKIIARFNAGVPVRILVDPRANPIYSGNQTVLNMFRDAGIPMRFKNGGGILHMKFMLFAGQNKLEFSGANFSPAFFVPTVPFQDYIDEAIYFTDDPVVVNSFKTQMDNLWTDTVNYSNFGNITGPLTRRYPTFPIDPELNFPPSADGSQDYYNRTAFNMNHESQKIDIIMYRITNDRFTNTTRDAVLRGIPVRLITEQDEYRNVDRQWDAYNVDLMYMAGVQIRLRAHQGLNHEKAVLLYSKGMTIFGSSNWTGPSSNSQQENNYFTQKSWFFNWFVDHFERKWNSAETKPFIPLPPTTPSYLSPANNALNQPTNLTLRWEGGPWAHRYDIYFGTTSNPPLIAADQNIGRVDNGVVESYPLPPLVAGTRYFWRIVSRTMANQTANGPTWSFTTAGVALPAPTVSSISPATGSTTGGTSVTITGTNFQAGATVTFGGTPATSVNVTNSSSITALTPARSQGTVGVTVTNPDSQSGTLANSYTYTPPPPPPPSPSGEVVLYAAEAPVVIGNWSLASDLSAAGGARIGNPDANLPKLAEALANPPNYFEMTFHALAGTPYRLWIRGKALADFWGNDSVFVQFSDSTDNGGAAVYRIGTTSGAPINLEECSGCGLSGWGWQDTGWGVGVLGPLTYFANSGSHTIRVQMREDGLSIDQIVLSPNAYLNSPPGLARNDSTILARSDGGGGDPAPTIASVSPDSGSTQGGTAVTINGSNFLANASVTFGGAAAASVNVTGATSLTAVTPARAAGSVNVTVTNTDGQSATLVNGFTYQAPPPGPAPTVTSVSPPNGPTTGGNTVTIAGTNFAAGATVTFGGSPGSNINVIGGTSISVVAPAHSAGSVDVAVTNADGQSGSLADGYTFVFSQPLETVMLEDDFNDSAIDPTKWNAANLFSGFTDTGIPVVETNQRLEIGPLLQNASGSHYGGIRSVSAFDFTNAYCQVAIVQATSSSTSSDTMLTVGRDANSYYRIFVEGGSLILQKRINGSKATLLSATYNSVNDFYWRIRHESATGNVVFETASDNGGSPGTWNARFSELWNTSAIPLQAVLFELKGGTWQPEGNSPGKAVFDRFKAARP